MLPALAFYTAGGSAAPARETVLAAALRQRPGWGLSPLWFSNPKLNSAGFAAVRSKDRNTVAFEDTAPNTSSEERRMSRSEICSPPAASIAARDPSSLPERCCAPEGTSLSLHSLPNPRASTKPVGTLTQALEISDWPLKVTGTDGKTGRDWCIEKVLLLGRDNWLRHHDFHLSEHDFVSKARPSAPNR